MSLRSMVRISVTQVIRGICLRASTLAGQESCPRASRQSRACRETKHNETLLSSSSHSTASVAFSATSKKGCRASDKPCSPLVSTSSTGRTIIRPSYAHRLTRTLNPTISWKDILTSLSTIPYPCSQVSCQTSPVIPTKILISSFDRLGSTANETSSPAGVKRTAVWRCGGAKT